MSKTPRHIKFRNHQNPGAGFDLIRLEELPQRADLDHSPFQIHLVEFYIIIFVEKEKGRHVIDFTDYPYEPGTILTIRKDQLHRFVKNEKVKGYLLLFTNSFLASYLEKLEEQKTLQLFNELLGSPKVQLPATERKAIADLIKRIKNEYFTVRDHYSLDIIRSELHILITQLYRIKSQQKQIIGQRKYLQEFIQLQNLVEQNIRQTKSVQDYARLMAVSTKTLNNITKSIINKTAKEFIDEICTKQIKRLLINTSLSVKEIAYTSGFEEIPNFYKYFKHQTKSTPETFREVNRF